MWTIGLTNSSISSSIDIVSCLWEIWVNLELVKLGARKYAYVNWYGYQCVQFDIYIMTLHYIICLH